MSSVQEWCEWQNIRRVSPSGTETRECFMCAHRKSTHTLSPPVLFFRHGHHFIPLSLCILSSLCASWDKIVGRNNRWKMHILGKNTQLNGHRNPLTQDGVGGVASVDPLPRLHVPDCRALWRIIWKQDKSRTILFKKVPNISSLCFLCKFVILHKTINSTLPISADSSTCTRAGEGSCDHKQVNGTTSQIFWKPIQKWSVCCDHHNWRTIVCFSGWGLHLTQDSMRARSFTCTMHHHRPWFLRHFTHISREIWTDLSLFPIVTGSCFTALGVKICTNIADPVWCCALHFGADGTASDDWVGLSGAKEGSARHTWRKRILARLSSWWKTREGRTDREVLWIHTKTLCVHMEMSRWTVQRDNHTP